MRWGPALSAWQKVHVSRPAEQTEQGEVSSHCLEEASKTAFHEGMPLKLHVEHTWSSFCFVSLTNRNHFYKVFMLPSLKHIHSLPAGRSIRTWSVNTWVSPPPMRHWGTISHCHQSWYHHAMVVVSDSKTNQTAGHQASKVPTYVFYSFLFFLFHPHPTNSIWTGAWPKTFCAYSDWHIDPLQALPQ